MVGVSEVCHAVLQLLSLAIDVVSQERSRTSALATTLENTQCDRD